VKVPINLASEPFRRDRPILAASIACVVVLAGLLGVLIFLILGERSQVRDVRTSVARLTTQVQNIDAEQARLEQTLRQPDNAQVFQRSLLLNTLIERKSISWTRLFADVESVMPYSVKLIQLRLPQINSRNEVSLDMKVGAQDWIPLNNEFLKRLEESPLFGPVQVRDTDTPSQNQPLYQYTVSVSYGQKL
jgi:Tfp pilus assembly protein PilN